MIDGNAVRRSALLAFPHDTGAHTSDCCCTYYAVATGATHPPDSAARNTASITAIFFTESSSGTGGGVPSRIARENASPCNVYWSHGGNLLDRQPAAERIAAVVDADPRRPAGPRVVRHLQLDPRPSCRGTPCSDCPPPASRRRRRSGPTGTPGSPRPACRRPVFGVAHQRRGNAHRLLAEHHPRRLDRIAADVQQPAAAVLANVTDVRESSLKYPKAPIAYRSSPIRPDRDQFDRPQPLRVRPGS